MGLAAWSESFRYVTQGPLVGSGAPVRWSNQTFPLQQGIMDAIDSPRWSAVAVIAPPQAGGKTDAAAVNPILKALQYDLRDCLYMSANAIKAADQWNKKFRPSIDAGFPDLIPEDREQGGTKERRDMSNGTSLFLAGCESIANVSSSTIPTIVCDDVQAMPASIGVMGHPCDVAFKRSAAYPEEERTHILLGTAGHTEDYLWRAVSRSAHFRPFVPCLKCGTYQILSWDRLIFDATDPLAARSAVSMTCENDDCDHQITDEELPRMLARYRWVARGQKADSRGGVTGKLPASRVAGFWWNALYWPFVEWATHVGEWVECRGDPDREKSFQQNVLVIPFEPPEEDTEALTVEALEEHQTPGNERGKVPAGVEIVTTTADVHDRFIYGIVRGWNPEDGTSHLIDAFTLGVHGPRRTEKLSEDEKRARIGYAIRDALEDLWRLEAGGWPAMEGDRLFRSSINLIDGGYRPDAVGQFVTMRNQGLPEIRWVMTRGKSDSTRTKPIWPSKSNRNIRGGYAFREISVDVAKHVVRELIAKPKTEPGAWHTYSDVDLEAYHRHLISEHFVPRRRAGGERHVWEKRAGAGPNHWWDCEVLQVAAALACGVRLVGYDRNIKVKPISLRKHFGQDRKGRRR